MGNSKKKASWWVPLLCWTIRDRELELYQERPRESSGAADHEENTKQKNPCKENTNQSLTNTNNITTASQNTCRERSSLLTLANVASKRITEVALKVSSRLLLSCDAKKYTPVENAAATVYLPR
jgi:hypothetical protein